MPTVDLTPGMLLRHVADGSIWLVHGYSSSIWLISMDGTPHAPWSEVTPADIDAHRYEIALPA